MQWKYLIGWKFHKNFWVQAVFSKYQPVNLSVEFLNFCELYRLGVQVWRKHKIGSYFQAEVVCRQLGFAGVDVFYTNSHFGEVPDDFSYDDVECSGSERTLDDCYSNFPDNCGYQEGAGVRCLESETTTSEPTASTSQGPSDHYGTRTLLNSNNKVLWLKTKLIPRISQEGL